MSHNYSSPLSAQLSSTAGDAQAVIDVAQRAADLKRLDTGHVYAVAVGDRVHQVDLTGEQYLNVPRAKRGTTTVRDVDSFLGYFDKHADYGTEVYADIANRSVTAVLDAHEADGARWGKHRLLLELRHTPAWLAWTGMDNKLVPQARFAEFVEDNLVDLVEPTAATMLELAQSFEATTSAEFQSSERLDSGARRFSFIEEQTARAGHKGDITIPATLTLALRPFEGSEPYKVISRFKYRLDKAKGELTLGFKIERPEDILTAAFADIRDLIDNGIPEHIAVLNGAPIRA